MESIEKEMMGYCSWDELSDIEKISYVLTENDRELDREFFRSDLKINRFESQ